LSTTLAIDFFFKGGSLYLFNRRVMRFFRKDGHNWRKKKDGRTVSEAHERLKVRQKNIWCYYYFSSLIGGFKFVFLAAAYGSPH
jgi:hypothetical protein